MSALQTAVVIARFELGQRLRRISTWVYFGIFFAVSFLFFIAAAGAFQSVNLALGGGKVAVNSPHTLVSLVQRISVFALLVIAAIAGQAVNQDFIHRTYPFLFTAPVSKGALVGGRFAGAIAALAVVHASAPLGCLVGSLMPFVDAKLIGPNRALAYLGPFVVSLLPNLLLLGAVFFTIGTLTRKMRAVYVTAVVLLLGYLLAGTLTARIENKLVAALLDPFGVRAFGHLTEYWTTAEKNSRLVPLTGVLLGNRLLWLAVGAAALAFTFRRFRTDEPLERAGATAPDVAAEPPAEVPAVAPDPAPAPRHPIHLLPRLTWLACRETVRNVGFLVILLAGVLFVIVSARVSGLIYGTETYPVTAAMLELGAGNFGLFVLIIVAVYAGEIVFREREARLDQIIDALPVPGWLLYVAKLGALLLVGVLLQLLAIACGIGVQIAKGYYKFELPLYAFDLLGLRMIGYFQLIALALFLQVLLGHKQLGQFALVLYYIVSIALPLFGFEHPLYRYGADTGYVYSDMNGYGHYLGPWAWFSLYWSLAALVLVLLSAMLWPRGQETRLRWRLRVGARGTGWVMRAALLLLGAGFVAVGGFIFWNTNVRNQYRTEADDKDLRVAYEKRHKAHENEPQPHITAVKVHFDIWPETRTLRARGSYELVNQTDRPIPVVYAHLSEDAEVNRFAIGDKAAPDARDLQRFYTFKLPQPLAPGAHTTAEFDLGYAPRGFNHDGASRVVVGNGTFVNNHRLPLIGYQPGHELDEDSERRKHGLPPRPRIADLHDVRAQQRTYLARDAHWITFAASVCTSPDQIAIIPGYLEREWQETDAEGRPRRCSAFTSPSPILNFFSVLSARYAVKRDRWLPAGDKGPGVAIEIYYHPGHEYDLDRMIRSIKASLDYFTKNFSPYQHRQVRIVEFPRYELYAQSFPNTIPYSEALGFIAKVDDSDKRAVDYPYYVTAHEVAHQWWAHQLIGADVQGATLLSESLSQYSALMVMKATYGEAQMKRFLRYELDSYLRSRAVEREKELPLIRVEHQAYIHYNKASLVFYALADAVGEAAVNRALAALLAKHAFRGPPYPTSLDLVTALKAEIPPAHHGLITDFLESITLYENRAIEARATPAAGVPGAWDVEIKLSSKKLHADELGVETEVPIGHRIDVGVLGEDDAPLLVEPRSLVAGEQTVKLRVRGAPKRAGVDPMYKLIDRKPGDNLVAVEIAEASSARK